MSREEFREEFTALFKSLASDFFENAFGVELKVQEIEKGETMSITEVADFFDISKAALHDWIKAGKINSLKKGNRRYFNRSYIEKFKMANFTFNERIPKNNSKYF